MKTRWFLGLAGFVLAGCSFSNDADRAMSPLLSMGASERWAEVQPMWGCDAETCGTLRGQQADDAVYYMQFSRNGEVRRAFSSVPFVRSGSELRERIRCQKGRWSTDEDVVTLEFEAAPDEGLEPATETRRIEIRMGGSVLAQRVGTNLPDVEEWTVQSADLPETRISAPCPKHFARESDR